MLVFWSSEIAPTVSVIHVNDILFGTNSLIHCFADDCTLHSSISLNQPVSVTELNVNKQPEAAALNRNLDIN